MRNRIAAGLAFGLMLGAVGLGWGQERRKAKAALAEPDWQSSAAERAKQKAEFLATVAKECEETVPVAPVKVEKGEQRIIRVDVTCLARLNEQYLTRRWKFVLISGEIGVVEKL